MASGSADVHADNDKVCIEVTGDDGKLAFSMNLPRTMRWTLQCASTSRRRV